MKVSHLINDLKDNSFSHDILIKDCDETLNSMFYKFNSKYYDYNIELDYPNNILYFYAKNENEVNEILEDIKKYYQSVINQNFYM